MYTWRGIEIIEVFYYIFVEKDFVLFI